MILDLIGAIFGLAVLVGIGCAIYAAGASASDDAHAKQLELQRAENQRLQKTAQRLAVSLAEQRAKNEHEYMQGFADGQSFEQQLLPEPSPN